MAFTIEVVVRDSAGLWDIMTAVGTVGTVIVAVVLGLREQRAASREIARLEQDRDRAVAAEVRRDREHQARHVAVWRDTDPPEIWEWCGEDLPPEPTHRLWIANQSEMPVFDVTPCVDDGQGATSFEVSRPAIRPGESICVDLPGNPHRALWFFRDVPSNEWSRDSGGILDLVRPSDAAAEDS
ncbi:hypothetical protein [Isoptericola sp. NPDC055881]